jgi:hypothetical protein
MVSSVFILRVQHVFLKTTKDIPMKSAEVTGEYIREIVFTEELQVELTAVLPS